MLVKVIKPGILVRNNLGMILKANSTVTLIIGDSHNIIVDTGFLREGKKIIQGLEKYNLSPADIDIVINTHLHPDHIGNNALFTKAKFIVHAHEFLAKIKNVEIIKGDFRLSENINLIETPGHTKGSISVVVNVPDDSSPDESKTYVIAGDALPIKDNYTQWVPPGINFNPQVALASMKRIVEIADFVIPGHDDIFEIKRS